MPLACGDDDDDDVVGTAGHSGSTSTAGKTSTAGTAGKSNDSGGSSNASGSSAGGVGGDEAAGAGGEGGSAIVATGRVRVVHASPSAPSVDIYVAGTTTAVAKGVAYGESTEFIVVDAGTVAFDLRAAGSKASEDPAFTTADITVDGDADYTLVAAGDFAHPEDADVGFRVLALEHDFEAPPAGSAVARIVHATSAWDAVDLDVVATNGVDVPALARFGSESNVDLPAGATIPVDFQTEADGVLSQLVLPKLTAGNELFVIATGNPGFPFRAPANGFALLVVDQDGKVSWVKEQPWIHMVHASDISTVDVYETTHTAASGKLLNDLAAEKLSAFQLPESSAGFTLKAVASDAAAGTATGLATGPTSTIEAGEHYLSYIASDTIQTIHEQFDLEQPTKVMLRGVHASTSITETVDFGAVVSNALSSALISGVMPTESSAEAGVATNPGNLILGASPHSLTTLLAQKTLSGTAAPIAGERDFVLLVGADGLWLVDTSVAGWTLR
ncbi:MAG: DUF4397 domain-containing protein [Myxococcales bacterium]